MKLNLPDDIVSRAEVNVADLRAALAVQLYADNRIDHADACLLAHMTPAAFNRELVDRAISVQQYPTHVRRSRRSAS